ncbi:metalloprotease [Cantharellus anzutake]|uniref:metalloprotease n=1 Tax=Cantharellus anzutake TaxID=1750568 RepID=UPI0019073539|nr:metalloprotease [Cantharellus anzutake]KAF8336860.1 metalloprotease [Cantharellus anzutake]
MRLSTLAALMALFGLPVFAAPTNITRHICGSHLSSAKLQSLAAELPGHEATWKSLVEEGGEKCSPKIINIHWHAIQIGKTGALGHVTAATIKAQIHRLNLDYAASGYSFRLAGPVNHVTKKEWFDLGDISEARAIAMKNALRVGGIHDLNVYSVRSVTGDGESLLGVAAWPWDYSFDPQLDGIVVILDSLPGSKAFNGAYSLGRTLVHETGHWLGLLHTFQGGCTGVGDLVNDTPPERTATFGCPTGKDTCLGGGPDPIHNFMDYSDDSCTTQFTAGQIQRARMITHIFRGIC